MGGGPQVTTLTEMRQKYIPTETQKRHRGTKKLRKRERYREKKSEVRKVDKKGTQTVRKREVREEREGGSERDTDKETEGGSGEEREKQRQR